MRNDYDFDESDDILDSYMPAASSGLDHYYDPYDTPLKFHKFLKYAGLFILAQVYLVIVLTFLLNPGDQLPGATFLVAVFYGISLAATLVTLIGFYGWKPCGFYGILVLCGMNVLDKFLALFLGGDLTTELIQLVLQGGITVPIVIYYLKRRPLFFEELQAGYIERKFAHMQSVATPGNIPVRQGSLNDRSGGDVTVCRVCGGKLNPGRPACMKCGTAIRETPAPTPAPTPTPTPAPAPAQPGATGGYCSQCGNPLHEGSRFCNRCGAKVL